MEDDMRTSKNVNYYKRKEVKDENEKMDIQLFISLIFGILAFLLKFRWAIWMSLTTFLAFMSDRSLSVPISQYYMNILLMSFGFIVTYGFR